MFVAAKQTNKKKYQEGGEKCQPTLEFEFVASGEVHLVLLPRILVGQRLSGEIIRQEYSVEKV